MNIQLPNPDLNAHEHLVMLALFGRAAEHQVGQKIEAKQVSDILDDPHLPRLTQDGELRRADKKRIAKACFPLFIALGYLDPSDRDGEGVITSKLVQWYQQSNEDWEAAAYEFGNCLADAWFAQVLREKQPQTRDEAIEFLWLAAGTPDTNTELDVALRQAVELCLEFGVYEFESVPDSNFEDSVLEQEWDYTDQDNYDDSQLDTADFDEHSVAETGYSQDEGDYYEDWGTGDDDRGEYSKVIDGNQELESQQGFLEDYQQNNESVFVELNPTVPDFPTNDHSARLGSFEDDSDIPDDSRSLELPLSQPTNSDENLDRDETLPSATSLQFKRRKTKVNVEESLMNKPSAFGSAVALTTNIQAEENPSSAEAESIASQASLHEQPTQQETSTNETQFGRFSFSTGSQDSTRTTRSPFGGAPIRDTENPKDEPPSIYSTPEDKPTKKTDPSVSHTSTLGQLPNKRTPPYTPTQPTTPSTEGEGTEASSQRVKRVRITPSQETSPPQSTSVRRGVTRISTDLPQASRGVRKISDGSVRKSGKRESRTRVEPTNHLTFPNVEDWISSGFLVLKPDGEIYISTALIEYIQTLPSEEQQRIEHTLAMLRRVAKGEESYDEDD